MIKARRGPASCSAQSSGIIACQRAAGAQRLEHSPVKKCLRVEYPHDGLGEHSIESASGPHVADTPLVGGETGSAAQIGKSSGSRKNVRSGVAARAIPLALKVSCHTQIGN